MIDRRSCISIVIGRHEREWAEVAAPRAVRRAAVLLLAACWSSGTLCASAKLPRAAHLACAEQTARQQNSEEGQ